MTEESLQKYKSRISTFHSFSMTLGNRELLLVDVNLQYRLPDQVSFIILPEFNIKAVYKLGGGGRCSTILGRRYRRFRGMEATIPYEYLRGLYCLPFGMELNLY